MPIAMILTRFLLLVTCCLGLAAGSLAPAPDAPPPTTSTKRGALLSAILFVWLDNDGDGAISRSEFEQAAARHPRLAQFLTHHPHLFERLDADGDARITRTEAEAARVRFHEQGGLAGALFRRIDSNGDGVISAAELTQARAELPQWAEFLDRHPAFIAQLDTDSDGRITQTELEEARARVAARGGLGGVLLDQLDTDHSGGVSQAEIQAATATFPRLAELFQNHPALFVHLDADGNGAIDRQELAQARAGGMERRQGRRETRQNRRSSRQDRRPLPGH